MGWWRRNLGEVILTGLFGLSGFLAVLTVGLGLTVAIGRLLYAAKLSAPRDEWAGLGDAVDGMRTFAFGVNLSLGIAAICGMAAAKRAAAHWLPDERDRRWKDARLYRGSGGRLTCLVPRVRAEQYRPLCRNLAAAADLFPADEPTITAGRAVWDFRRDSLMVGFDWHVWAGFMVVARTPAADHIVAAIAQRLGVSRTTVDG